MYIFLLNLNFFSFLFFKFFLFYFLLKVRTTPHYLSTFIFIYFYDFFSIRKKKLFFFFFFFFSFFLSFLFLVFLSYFLLKSSNTPLLFLNFHFHLTITLQKKIRERSPIFKLNFIFISKFWVLVFVFKYFISESNLYDKFFNLCFSVCDINFGHLRIQYSIPISIQEFVDYSLPLLTLCFLPQNTSISSFPLLFPIQFCESLWLSGLRRTL